MSLLPEDDKVCFCEEGGNCLMCVGKDNCTNYRHGGKLDILKPEKLKSIILEEGNKMNKDNEMFDTKTVFNSKYFKVGEAIKIVDSNKGDYDALVLEVEDNVLKIITIEWVSPMTGCSQYKETRDNIWISDIQEGKIKIIKYNKSEDR